MICTHCALGDFFRLFRLRLFISSELQNVSAALPGIAEEHGDISRLNNGLLEKISLDDEGRARQHAALYILYRSAVKCWTLIGRGCSASHRV